MRPHGPSLALRVASIAAGIALTLPLAGCGPRQATPVPDHVVETTSGHGSIAIFTPSDGITVSQHTPANKWDKLVPEITKELKTLGFKGNDIHAVSSSGLDRQSRDLQDYVVDHVTDTDGQKKDDTPMTLVVAPAADADDVARQYGDFAGQTIAPSGDGADQKTGDGDADGAASDDGKQAGADEAEDSGTDEDAKRDAAIDRLVSALDLAKDNGMHVVVLSNAVKGVSADAFVRMATAELIGRAQAQQLVDKLQLAKTSPDNPKVIEVLLPYDPDGGAASDAFAAEAFAGVWKVLEPYFRDGRTVSASGTLTADSKNADWRQVAFDGRKADLVRKELGARLASDDGEVQKIDGIVAMNDFVASATVDELAELGYQGSAADINPTITIGGIVGSIAGRRDLKRGAVPDPIKSPENDDAAADGDGAAKADASRWPIVTGYGGYLDAMPRIVEGKQWMTALTNRKQLAADIATVCDRLNRGQSLDSLASVSQGKVAGAGTAIVSEDLLAVNASNLKETLIDPGYISMADAGL